MKPRHLIPLSWAFMLAMFNVQSAAPAKPATPPPPALDWHDVTQWGVEGRAWPEMERKRWFDRLPAAAEGKVTPAVWSLSREARG